jgi:hypothetical protein
MKETPMKEALRKQLIELGIPVERQDAGSLSRLFPTEFNVANFGLSETDIAEVLVAFARRGLISISGLPEDATIRRSSGKHVCHFYRDEEEMIRMTAAFLEEGLRTGERCLWILPPWLDGDRARAASRATRGGLEDAEASGRLFFLTETEVYLNAGGMSRSSQEIIDFWLEQERKARDLGLVGIRIAGDGTGMVSADTWKAGAHYELRADAAFEGRRVTALCTYSLATVAPERLAEILSRHRCGLVSNKGEWHEIRAGAGISVAIEFLAGISK